jgi:DNA-binding FadR family transcriptional regulator
MPGPTIDATDPPASAEALREAILEKLRSRQWRAGQRLPTERVLGEQYGLSVRPCVACWATSSAGA